MATTAYGTNDALAVKLWSRKLFREALKQCFMSKYMGEGSDNLIQLLNDTKKGAGDRVTVGLRMQLSGTGVQGDATLEGNEEALTTYSDAITIDQLRHAVRSAGKMSEQRIPFSVREEARMGLQDWWADRIDTSIINQLTGNTGQADNRYNGFFTPVAPVQSATAGVNRWVFPENQTTEGSLSSASTFTLATIDKAVANAKIAVPLVRPLKVGGNEYFVAFIHPFQTYALRASTGANDWPVIQRAAMQGGEVTKNPIFTGAIGVYNNTIIVETARVPTITASTRRAVFCGAQACIMAVGQDNQPEKMSWVEELFDYENQLGVSAGMIYGTKKAIFNSRDFGTVAMSSYAVAP